MDSKYTEKNLSISNFSKFVPMNKKKNNLGKRLSKSNFSRDEVTIHSLGK